MSLVDYIELVAEREAKLRNSYEETSNLSSDEFLAMILVDSAFVIESLLRFSSQSKANKDHGIFGKPLLEEDIWYDMLVLESQLPFFILEDLFVKAKIIIPPEQDERRSLIWLIHNAFKDKVLLAGIQELWEKLCCSKIEHFLHFVRICHLPQQLPLKREMKSNLLQCTKLALRVPSATQLHQAGVKFKVGLTGNIYDIKFKNGILEIPCLRVCGQTYSIFRNLLAYERWHFMEQYIHDYFFVIEGLIDTPNDVELLVQSGIIEFKRTDRQEVADLINNVLTGTIISETDFYFADLCEALNAHCIVPWNKWKATLGQVYSRTPGVALFIIAFLILKFIQLVFTIMSYYQS